VYEQQFKMYEKKSNKVQDRIVSILQPYIRAIVIGKAKSMIEFGTKLSLSVVNGNTFIHEIRLDNFNEGLDLPMQIKKYKKRFGFYQKSVHANKKYQ